MYYNERIVDKIIQSAIFEDIGMGDITTDNLVDAKHKSNAVILAKDSGVLAGLDIAKGVFKNFDYTLKFVPLFEDGDRIKPGDRIATLNGFTRSILKAERTALNFLQRLSGIATKTRYYTELVKDFPVKIVDTRKTTPTLRILEKYAVVIGGGFNHRMGLYDAVMIKDNHIAIAKSISKAIQILRDKIPHTVKIEVEVTNIDEVKEALEANADIVMLDNMSIEDMRKAVEYIKGRLIVEASGGITDRNLIEVARTGVDVISIGSLTTKIDSLDISLEIVDNL